MAKLNAHANEDGAHEDENDQWSTTSQDNYQVTVHLSHYLQHKELCDDEDFEACASI
jgi:hypothetical protein